MIESVEIGFFMTVSSVASCEFRYATAEECFDFKKFWRRPENSRC